MDRLEKGCSLYKHISDYCVLDLETTGFIPTKSKIIEISALRVRDNKVVAEYSTLVNPQCSIPKGASAVNRITDDMVKDAPTIETVIPDFLQFVGNDVIIGYNNATFDMNMTYDAVFESKGIPFRNNYIDVLYLARNSLPELDNHRLETVCNHFSFNTVGEHRALKDCYLTKACYDRLYNDFGDEMFVSKGYRPSGSSSDKTKYIRSSRFSEETKSLQELQQLLENIIEDGQVTLAEFSALSTWMEGHRELQGNYPFDRVYNALEKVLKDGAVSAEELEDMQILFSEFADPVSSQSSHDTITSIKSKHIVVTGDFDYGSRADVCALFENAGGIIDSSVKKATDYVVVGSKGSDSWKTGNYGSKIQKALELKDKGERVEIIQECNFIPAIQSILENGEPDSTDKSSFNASEYDWKQQIRSMLTELIAEYELPTGSLYLSDNYSKADSTQLISHSVCIWEPHFPAIPNEKPGQNKIVVTIVLGKTKSRPNELVMNIREIQEADLHGYLPYDFELLKQSESDKKSGTAKVRFDCNSKNLVNYIRKSTEYCLAGYESKAARFGCCSSFNECSDAKKCVHENKLYSKACIYRDSLDEGRIFYGKNRNV